MRRGSPTRSLEQQALELKALGLPGAQLTRLRGSEVRYCFEISPSSFSPLYKCLLVIPRGKSPRMYIISPDLVSSNGGKRPPHIYGHENGKTQLCLWWPKQREWHRDMKFIETYIPWTAEWLWHYEYWRATDEWAGGGVHPNGTKDD
ncbi:hypothetical protein [Paraburkholderia terrae]|jgi:hypothetical protein|uniref:Type II CBASS E2 protein domain-containing protein n=1 Tax=Paraburkholderia terrae TaxID=311230 RepID=A0A2I8EZS0_9BURK|nr:hypothetical protein [Paraburkholderia terrae]AUT64872.1 hypothetical protein C2L65_35200 [Paraburkholderia terrae]